LAMKFLFSSFMRLRKKNYPNILENQLQKYDLKICDMVESFLVHCGDMRYSYNKSYSNCNLRLYFFLLVALYHFAMVI